MIDEEKGLTLSDIFRIIRLSIARYWRIAVVPGLLVLCFGCILAWTLPNYFESRAVIFIQPQRVSSQLLDNPEKDEMGERLEALVQEILSRTQLRQVVEQYGLYPEYSHGDIGKSMAISQLRDDIVIDTVKSPAGKQLLETFSLTYTNKDPLLAYKVTKALANLFIDESNVARRSEVQGTEEFLEAQLTEARKKLEVTEKQVQDFMSANYGRLPEHFDQAVARLQNYQAQLSTNSQLLAAHLQRRTHLQEELTLANKRASDAAALDPSVAGGALSSDPAQGVAQLEASLAILLSKYSERHPDVIATRQRIAALKQQIGSSPTKNTRHVLTPTSMAFDQETRSLRDQLNQVDVEVTRLQKENDELRTSIQDMEQDIKLMPKQEVEFTKINRDYANVKSQYDELLKERERAALQSSLVKSQKGTQFRIVEDPDVPFIPSGPNRLLILAFSALAAVGLTALVPFGAYFVNGAYKFRGEIEKDLGIEVIGLLPPMETNERHERSRMANMMAFASFVGIFVVGGIAIFLVV